jgi:hypothetical protein
MKRSISGYIIKQKDTPVIQYARRIMQTCNNIIGFKIGIVIQYLFRSHSRSNQIQHLRNRKTHTPDRRATVANILVNGYSIQQIVHIIYDLFSCKTTLFYHNHNLIFQNAKTPAKSLNSILFLEDFRRLSIPLRKMLASNEMNNKKIKVAIMGGYGTFHEIAAHHYFKEIDVSFPISL